MLEDAEEEWRGIASEPKEPIDGRIHRKRLFPLASFTRGKNGYPICSGDLLVRLIEADAVPVPGSRKAC